MAQFGGTTPRRPEAEARQATVLKCDLVSSTRTKMPLDLHDQLSFQRGFERLVTDVARRHGAHVMGFEGDGALIVVGLRQPREDAADSAVRMGLELVEAVRVAELVPSVQVLLRVGIASGSIAVVNPAAGTHGEMIAGLTIDMAERLRALAGAGETLISDATKRLAAGYFRYEDLGTVQAKGFDKGVRAWRVVGESHGVSRFEARRVDSRRGAIIGRGEELALLSQAWAASSSGHGRAVCLMGEAGIGKSRLARAALEAAALDGANTLTIDCTPSTPNTPLYPIGVLLRRTANILPSSTDAEKQVFAEQLLARLLPDDEVPAALTCLAPLLGLEGLAPPPELEPGELRSRAIATVVQLLRGLAAERQLAVLCEDLHWVDDTTATVIARVCESVDELRALIIVTARPTSDPPQIDLSKLNTIALQPLDHATAAALVRSVAGSNALPDDTVLRIVARCEGVPLVLEEVTRAAVEAAGRAEDASAAAASEREVPPPLQLAVEARLGRWPQFTPMVQSASVMGREFSRRLLERMVSDAARPFVAESLEVLARDGLFSAQQSSDGNRVRFKHAMICDAVYNTLLRGDRQRLHSQIADILIGDYKGTPDVAPDVIAEHLRKAARCVESIGVRLEAASDTAARGAYVESEGHCAAGLALIDEVDDLEQRRMLQFQLLIQRGVALTGQHGYSAMGVEEAYRQAQAICGDQAEAEMLYPIMRGLATVNLVRGNLATAYDLSIEGLKLSEQSSRVDFHIDAMSVLCYTTLYYGRIADCRDWIMRCLDLYRAEDGTRLTYPVPQDAATAAIALLPTAEWLLGDPKAAEVAIRDGQAHVELLNRDFDRALLNAWIAGARQTQRRYAEALNHAEIAVRLSQQHGYREWFGIGTLLALIARAELTGDPQIIAEARAAYSAYTGAGAYVSASHYLHGIARACVQAGDQAAAQQVLEEATLRAEASGETRMNAEILILQAELEANAEAARLQLLKALAIAKEQGTVPVALRAAASLVLRSNATEHDIERARATMEILEGRATIPTQRSWLLDEVAAMERALTTTASVEA